MSEQPGSGPGRRLREAREALEVSTREVADALNLPVRVIEALEADDYEQQPPTVFTRGYLRSYARLLELSQDEMVSLYPVLEEAADDSETAPTTGITQSLGDPRVIKLGGGIALLIVLLLVVLWAVLGGSAPDSDPVPANVIGEAAGAPDGEDPGAGPADASILEQPVEPDAGDELPPAARAAVDEVVDPASDAVEEGAVDSTVTEARTVQVPALEQTAVAQAARASASGGEEPAVQPELPEPQRTTADIARREQRITEFGDDRLVFTFTEDCWVEVKTPEGANLYSDLNRAGRTLVLHGQGPFRILLGYAPGVGLEFNGETVALGRYTRNNVASLVLGQ